VAAKKFNKTHLAQLQSGKNPAFQLLVDNIMSIQKAHTSLKMDPLPLSYFVKKFERDYFLYWGSVTTTVCLHYILWFISREPVGVSAEQVRFEPEISRFRVEISGGRVAFDVGRQRRTLAG
jgi:carbonic anhydrase